MDEPDRGSLELTLEILSDPEMIAGLKRSLAEEQRGEFVDVDDLH